METLAGIRLVLGPETGRCDFARYFLTADSSLLTLWIPLIRLNSLIGSNWPCKIAITNIKRVKKVKIIFVPLQKVSIIKFSTPLLWSVRYWCKSSFWRNDFDQINANFIFWHTVKIWNSKWISGVETRKFPSILGDRFMEIILVSERCFCPFAFLHLASTLDYPQSHVICWQGSRRNAQKLAVGQLWIYVWYFGR